MTFDNCFEIIMKYEGGYSNDSLDPGGETKWGISKRAYPNLNVKELTLDNAKQIYKIDYWDRTHCDLLSADIRLIVFDCAINQGVARASIYLQRSVGINSDGVLGPITMSALRQVEPQSFIVKYAGLRHESYTKNPRWNIYGKGWSARLLDVTMKSLIYSSALSVARKP